jgi:hypothetical protein
MNDEDNTNAKQTWQSQNLEITTMSVQQVRAKVEKLSRIVRRRTLIGGFACMTVLLSFFYFSASSVNALERIGAILTALAAAFIGGQLLRRKIGPRRFGLSGGGPTEPSVNFYRSELQRQRDFHRGVWLWSRLLIFIPGPAVFFLGLASANPTQAKFIGIEVAVFALLLIVAIFRNLRHARGYQRELDELKAQE